MKFTGILHKAFDLLQARPLSGGLEISDTAIRFISWNGTYWEVASVRLSPGVVVDGRLQDQEGLLEALYALRDRILGKKHARSKKKVNIILSLSSARVFTQVFHLPKIQGESLDNAISLNVRMASPTSEEETYSGWQLVGESAEEMRLEVLSIFLEREMVDAFTDVLHRASFVPMAAESSALSLTRTIRAKATVDVEQPLMVVAVNASGIDIMVLRHGHLHFDYFNSWQEVQEGNSTISREQFRETIVRNLRQVINFYNTHWSDQVAQVLVTAGGMQEQVIEVIQKTFQLQVAPLVLNTTPPLAPEWFTALGGALRAAMPRREDTEASLLGIDAREEFRREQTVAFLRFWRVLVPASMAILLLVFIGSNMFLRRLNNLIQQPLAETAGTELATAEDLFEEAEQFNRLVDYFAFANSTYIPKSPELDLVLNIVSEQDVTITSFTTSDQQSDLSLRGIAPTQEAIIALKDAMNANPSIQDVNLPLTAIQEAEGGYIFSMTFSIALSSAE